MKKAISLKVIKEMLIVTCLIDVLTITRPQGRVLIVSKTVPEISVNITLERFYRVLVCLDNEIIDYPDMGDPEYMFWDMVLPPKKVNLI